MGQPQDHIAGAARSGGGHLLDDVLHLVVVDEGDQRRHQHRHRHPGPGQFADRAQPLAAAAGARLQLALEAVVQGGHRHRHGGAPLPGHGADQVQIAQHQGTLGDQAERVPAFTEHLQDLPGKAPLPLHRLVGVGGGADHQRPALVTGLAQGVAQHLGGVVLAEDFRLEILARGQTVAVAGDLDLIEVAVAFAEDRAEQLQQWRAQGRVDGVQDEQARAWFEAGQELWTVVVRPWVLVQPVRPH
ncbi:MAG: hypothetical protein CL543_02910 [Alcanivorax sp.]|nr:hypothetical protein [Alcanivorax sp.]